MTVKSPELVAVPPGVVTTILPVVAPEGTAVLICVLETTVKVAMVPLKRTLVAPVKFVPVIATDVPTGPLAGANEAIVGAWMTVKSPVLVAVPPGVVTTILPVVAPEGTAVLICVLDTTVKVATVPLKRTLVAPVKFVPLIVTDVPTGPFAGANDVIVGAWTTEKSPLLVAVPPGVVTVILPVVAPAGTLVLI